MKVLHILYQSLPTKVGSTIRSRDIMMSQKEIGLEVIAATSPFQESIDKTKKTEIIYGTKYYRSNSIKKDELASIKRKSFLLQLKKLFRIFSFTFLIYRIVKREEPDVLHAHATFFTGISSYFVAKITRKPLVYEVRSLWEEHRLVANKNFKTRVESGLIRFFETVTAKLANKVVVISIGLKENLIKRRVKESKIEIINNAVNFSVIKDKQTLSNNKDITLGYIGSIVQIEGLELLIEVISGLQVENVKLLIFGDGPAKTDLEKQVLKIGAKNVEFKGSIASEKVHQAYESIDVIINPRISTKITNDVTPLKPLEAMAYKKLVIASDVNGMKEIITNGQTGLLFKADDKKDLERLLLKVYNDGIEKYKSTIEEAFNYVRIQKSWHSNAIKYMKIYEELIEIKRKAR